MAFNLTGTGAGYNTTGKFGASLNAGRAQSGTPVLTAGITAFSVSAWIKGTTGATRVAVGQAGVFWIGHDASGNALGNYGSSSAAPIGSTTSIADGNWHHVELCVSASGGDLFVDGVLVNHQTPTLSGSGPSYVNNLGIRDFSGGSGYTFAGEVDDVAIWNVHRHTATFTPPTTATDPASSTLIALYNLDSNLNDSANPVTGPVLSSPTITGVTATSANPGITTDTGSGTLYVVLSTVNTAPTAAQVKAGQNNSGATTPAANQAVSSTGSKTQVVSGLSASTTYYPFWVHTNGSGSDSLVTAGTSFTTSAAAATSVTLSGPTTGTTGVASSAFTVGANGTITGTVTVTPSDGGGGGTFSPTSVAISSGTPTATFTYTPGSVGAKTISVTNNGGLTSPSSITYTSTAAAKYTRVDTTDTISGQSIMVLVPNSNAAIPYNSANPTGVILYCHGSGEDQQGLVTDSLKTACRDALLDAGYILAGTNARGNNWGNQTSVDDYVALEKYVRDNYNVKGVCLWSQSMGGLDGLSVLAQGKFPVLGWLGTYPVCNLANLYSLGTYTSAINSAYGITGTGNATYANLTRGMDPALKSGFAWRHVPMRFYASYGDTVVPRANNTDVLAAIVAGCAREATVIACTGNHGDPTHFQASDYVAFFSRCFATPVAQGRPATTRTVTLTLTTDGATPAANLSGLTWAWWDQGPPSAAE